MAIERFTLECGCVVTVYGDRSAPPWVAYCEGHLAGPDLLTHARRFLDLWPLAGYELEGYCDATLVPAFREAHFKGH